LAFGNGGLPADAVGNLIFAWLRAASNHEKGGVMKKKGWWILSVCLVLAVVFLMTDYASAQQKVIKWRAVTHQLVGTSRYKGSLVPFCEMVKKASNGRLIIEPYGAGVLFPVSESFDAVRDGVVQMAMVWSGYWAGKDPTFALAGSRPGDPITDFSENFYRAEQLAPILGKVYEKFGVKSLGAFDFATTEILCTNKPIRSLADFKGKKIRSGGIGATFYTMLGAGAVSLSAPEIYQALQLGTVDGAEYNDWLVNKEMGLHEVTKFVIEPCLHTGATDDKELIVNPKAWAELPDDLKSIVLAARDHARYLSGIAYEVEGKKAKQEWVKRKVQIIDLPPNDVKEMRNVAAKLLVDFGKKNPEAGQYVAGYAKVLNDLGYVEEAKALGHK
jgi:TRAP-type mannitol/chloroaromatic compound transport system substrate-binding protein